MTDIARCGQHNLVNDSAWDDLRWLGRHLSSDAWFDSCYGDLDDVRRLLNFVREVQQPFAWSLTWIGARAIRAFLNELLKPAKFSEDQVYRLIEKKRLPAGKFGTQLIASPAAIRERLATLANGGDADGAHGDGRAGEMTDRE